MSRTDRTGAYHEAVSARPDESLPSAPASSSRRRASGVLRRRASGALRRRRVLVAVVALFMVSTAAVGGRAVLAGDVDELTPRATASASSQPVGGPDRDQQQLDALTALLAARRAAVLDGDRNAWVATTDPASSTFRTAQGRVFDNLAEVPFADWTYQYLGRAPELSEQRVRQLGGQAWVARVLAGYRLRGDDGTASQVEQYLTVVSRAGRWYLASTGDGGTAPQPWDLGRVEVARGERVIVLGTAPRAALTAYAAAGDRAVDQVSDVWGRAWSRRAVLVAPRSQREFGRLLLRSPEGLGQVAAVTTGDLGGQPAPPSATGRAGNDRVVVNPTAFARLGATGRRVVLSHELTHVAVRQGTSSAVPTWLSEGFADYVGYRGTGVSRRVGAADLLALVRAGRAPRTLPSSADFDPTRTTIAPSYSASWLACLLIADTYGPARLVALYRQASSAQPGAAPDPEAALRQSFVDVLGTSEGAFTVQWRRYLDRLARP